VDSNSGHESANKPLISVLVCTYNRAELLGGALQSLVVQTLHKSRYEVIIVDNNSTDATHEIARDYAGRYDNFKVIREDRQGKSYACNTGIAAARGKYIAFMDDDAKASPDWVERILSFISRRPEVVAFGGPYKSFSLVELPKWYKESYGSWTLGDVEIPIAETEWINGTNMVFRRTLLLELGGFNENMGMTGKEIAYGADTEIFRRIKEKRLPVYYVPDMVVEHLIADYKMSLRWMLMSYYRNGFSGLETFGLKRRPLWQFMVTGYLFIRGLTGFVLSREKYLKARFLESFRAFAWSLGLTVRMFRD
jgi:glycosyltransferase involved in cell wall biosynthesis